jgi:hypothetical protein
LDLETRSPRLAASSILFNAMSDTLIKLKM